MIKTPTYLSLLVLALANILIFQNCSQPGSIAVYSSKIETSSSTSNSISDLPPTNPPVQGVCGAANLAYFSSAPQADLCRNGTTSLVTSNDTQTGWVWSCQGLNGGSNQVCMAKQIAINGLCGPANGISMDAAPNSNLCVSGKPSSVVKDLTGWKWSCDGHYGGSSAQCSTLFMPINAKCGTANGLPTSVSPSVNLCDNGSMPTVLSNGNGWSWTCPGQYGGANAICASNRSAISGRCGSAHQSILNTQPSSALCSDNYMANVYATSTGWNWTCPGQYGGANATCLATHTPKNAQCGISNGLTFNYQPSVNLCADNTTPAINNTSNGWSWACKGQYNGTDATCSAIHTPITGTCGASHGIASRLQPRSQLCGDNSNPSVSSAANQWNWTCPGHYGGAQAVCSAEKFVSNAYISVTNAEAYSIYFNVFGKSLDTSQEGLSTGKVERDQNGYVTHLEQLKYEDAFIIDKLNYTGKFNINLYDPSSNKINSYTCTFDNAPIPCDSTTTMTFPNVEGVYILKIRVQTDDETVEKKYKVAVFERSQNSGSINAGGFDQATSDTNFFLGEHSKARASVGEPHQFWLMPYSTLYVDGNYCVSDKFSQANDECKIVVASDARFFNRGNTFMPSQKKTNLYLGSRSVFIVQGNFGNKRTTLHISQDSYIFFTVAITEFSVQILTNDFDTRACAFSSTGSCPNNLVYLR